jgi:hypothetical protein
MRLSVSLLALSLAGCAALPQKPPFLTDQWGGPHAGLTLEGGGGRLVFDCAAGTIDEPIANGGAFEVQGTYMPGRGGPVRVGEIYISKKATYSGTVEKDVLQLSVALDDGEQLGPFTLTRGVPPQITRCL